MIAEDTSFAIAMTTAEAKQVTERIKLLVSSIAESTEKVLALIEKARSGSAHEALGYESWTAYVVGEFRGALDGLQRAERIPIAGALASAGMSTRAVASITNTSVGTAHQDIVDAGVQDLNTSTTTGLDGKEYVRNGRPTSTGVIDIGDSVPPPKPKARRRPLPDQYRDAVWQLEKAVERLERLQDDDRFDAARDAYDCYHRKLATQVAKMTSILEVHVVAAEARYA